MRVDRRVLLVAALTGLTLVCSCRKPVGLAAQPMSFAPATADYEYRVVETILMDGAVSVHLEVPPAPTGAKPTVISFLGDNRPLRAAGFNTLTYKVNANRLLGPPPTPAPHRESVGKWVLASPSAAFLGERYLRQIAAEGVEVVPAVLDWLETRPEVDARRFGMVGVSTNGFTTLQAAAADSRLKAVVAIAACGDYHRFLQLSSMGIDEPLSLDAGYDEWLRSQELVHHPESIVPTPLLMQNRATDELVPIDCADETARVLRAAYAGAGAAERFEYVRGEQEGHGIDRSERERAIEWLKRWLQPE